GAERDDQPVVPRVDLTLLDVDLQLVDLRAVLPEPVVDEARRGRTFVLHDQRTERRAHRRSPADAGSTPSSSRSTSAATWRTESAKRDTISASSASEVVNGGAKRLWSPAIPSRVGCVERTTRPRSSAASSIRPATRSSGGRKPGSRGST